MPIDLPLADRYDVGPVIGRGAMGEVRRGRDRRLGRDVAIKYLRADLAADLDVRARFEDEARAAARLSHPAIVTVFDSGEADDGVPYLVMECLPGTTLADELAAGPIEPARVGTIASAIAGALAAAHEVGVIHRDVKPGNILVTDTGEVKLADFGIAKSTDGVDRTATHTVVGTPAYLAPERLAGEPATARSDIYSLGVVLFEALTGHKPFRGDTPVALAHAMHTTTPESAVALVPDADPALTATVDRMLARDPGDRPASGREVEALLTAGAAATVPIAAVPTTGGDATVPIAAPTARLPLPVSVHGPSDPAGVADRPARAVGPAVGRGGIAILVAVVVVLAVAWFGTRGGDGSGGPGAPTTVTTAPGVGGGDGLELPPALEGAIDRLEEAISP